MATRIQTPTMTDAEKLASYIRKARERKGLSLAKLEAITGISKNHIHYLEQAKGSHPGAELLGRLSDALDFSIEDLYLAIGWKASPYQGETVQTLVDELMTKSDLRQLVVIARELSVDRMESLTSMARVFAEDSALKTAMRETMVVSGRAR